jgi:hypothetical protein
VENKRDLLLRGVIPEGMFAARFREVGDVDEE